MSKEHDLLVEAWYVLVSCEGLISPLSNEDLIRRIGKVVERPLTDKRRKELCDKLIEETR